MTARAIAITAPLKLCKGMLRAVAAAINVSVSECDAGNARIREEKVHTAAGENEKSRDGPPLLALYCVRAIAASRG